MSGFERFDSFLAGVEEYLAKPVGHYCLPETSDDVLPDALVAMDGSLCSLIRVDGLVNLLGREEYQRVLERFIAAVQTRLERRGHAFAFYFTYEPERAMEVARDCLAPSIEQSKALGMSLEGLYRDWAGALSRYLSGEQTLIAVWTTPDALSKGEKKRAMKARASRLKNVPAGRSIQIPGLALEPLRDEHRACVNSLVTGLSEGGVVCKLLGAGEAVREMRAALFPAATPRDWRPRMFGDPLPLRIKEGKLSEPVNWMYARFREQIFIDEGVQVDTRTMSLGGLRHNPVAVTLPPGEPESFGKLFQRLRQKRFPWRLAVLLEGDGMAALGMRRTLARVLHFASSENKKFNRAVEQLEALRLRSVPMAKLRIMADTWVHEGGENTDGRLRDQADYLLSTLSTWGGAQATDVIGDPMLGLTAAAPGMMRKFPVQPACAPLYDASIFLPLTRPVSVWQRGSFPLRSVDGKLTPYQPGSSQQAAWIDAGVATMGGGKSVSLNALNLAFLLQPGLPELPYLLVIDIGPSSRGVISTVRANLPDDQKHLAVFKRLRMDPAQYAINTCDTELGCPMPTERHRAFLVNLVALLATDPLTGKAPSGMIGLIEAAVDSAFASHAPDRNPKRYEPHIESDVEAAIEKAGLELDEKTTWWEIVRALYEAGDEVHASIAQRHAVPTLIDIGNAARAHEIAQVYGDIKFNGEKITNYLNRVLSVELSQRFPILVKPTKFELRNTRVVAIDLDEVAPRGSQAADHQTAVMYLVARFAGAQRFFLQDEDVQKMPDWIASYHAKRISMLRQIPKRLCFDEFHRVNRFGSAAEQIVQDVEVAVRESRKWNLHIGLYTQRLEDIPEALRDLLSTVFIFNAGNPAVARRIGETLGLPESACKAIENLPPKPRRAGAALIGIYQTGKGRVVASQALTLGPQALWAFSSTAEDARLRDRLYAHLGIAETLSLLSRVYPGGVQGEVERRRLTEDSAGRDFLDEIFNEVVDLAHKNKAKGVPA
jgi:intracellular multiplication protein IcmB